MSQLNSEQLLAYVNRIVNADYIADVLEAQGNDAAVAKVGEAVNALCARFPVYGPAMRATYGMK